MRRPKLFLARLVPLGGDPTLFAYTIPESLKGYLLRSILAEVETDATAGNRQLAVSVDNRQGNMKMAAAESTFQTASEINLHTFGGTGTAYESAGSVSFQGGSVANFSVHTPMQEIVVEGGDVVRLEATGMVAGDGISNPVAWFEILEEE